jgi:uncharacterized membrane protein YraQ (UPF0718 family)
MAIDTVETERVARTERVKRQIVKSALIACAIIWVADLTYKVIKDISYVNREQCVLFRVLPHLGFVIFEYIFETMLIVFVGIFFAVWLSRQFVRLRRFLPRNPVTAFLYGAAVPICACGVIPLVSSMRGKMGFTTMIAFVLAAPVLSPYTIVISFAVLGPTYGVLRILSAFVMTMVCALVVGIFERRLAPRRSEAALSPDAATAVADRAYVLPEAAGPTAGVSRGIALQAAVASRGCTRQCTGMQDIYLETLSVFKGLLPYLAIAGSLGVGLEYLGPRSFLMHGGFGTGTVEVLVWTMVGVPLYLCNGAEVLFLRPLVSHGFPLGTAVAFSLTSTAVCVTSIAMLFKVIGTRLTLILTACVSASAVGLALLINRVM